MELASIYRWKIHKATKYGLRLDRYLSLDLRTQSITFLDLNNKTKSEFGLNEIKSVTGIGSKRGQHDKRKVQIVFHNSQQHRPYDLKFESELDCNKVEIEFCEPKLFLLTLHPNINSR